MTTLVDDVVRTVERLLAYRLRRALHVVVYASNEKACRALDRQVPASALLAPLHTRELALIAAQSPAADPRNGDAARMRRHLCHELAHVCSAERTGSVKRLGDGGRDMRLPSWLDEGFAVNVAAAATASPELVEAAIAACAGQAMSSERMAAAFADLNSPDRELAFATATAHVASDIRAHGLTVVFERLAPSWRPGSGRPSACGGPATSGSRGARCGGG